MNVFLRCKLASIIINHIYIHVFLRCETSINNYQYAGLALDFLQNPLLPRRDTRTKLLEFPLKTRCGVFSVWPRLQQEMSSWT